MGFPTDYFPVLFAIPRVAGWLAHWRESLLDPEQQRIWRPRQLYIGEDYRPYTSNYTQRDEELNQEERKQLVNIYEHPFSKRYNVGEKPKSRL